jgi:hypothetical protein
MARLDLRRGRIGKISVSGTDAMSSGPSSPEQKLGYFVRLLDSPLDNEVVAAARALTRTLKSAGSDIHALAERIEKPNGNGLSEADMKKLFDAGYAAGVQAAEKSHQRIDEFDNTDGKPNWDAVALFLQRNKARLDSRHHEFVDRMASQTAWGDEPTERQHKYLHGLFFKLGGKITS